VHVAAVLDDGVLGSLTAQHFKRVFAPKVDAAWHLHELTEGLGLSRFILFSSAAGVLGGPGQGTYAAANSFLDALASYRRARDLPGISMAWGQWQQDRGITSELGNIHASRAARSGIAALSPKEGLALFDAACFIDEALTVPVRFDLKTLRAQAKATTIPPLLSSLVRVPAKRANEDTNKDLARHLANAPAQDRERIVLNLVRTEVATVLGHTSPEAINTQRAFLELGFDSLTAIELRNRLNTATNLHLPPTLIFDHPNTTTLAQYIQQEVERSEAPTSITLDAELDKLELMLSSLTSESAEHRKLTRRLRGLLSRLDEAPRHATGASVAQRLEAASDDEIFGFIEAELDNSEIHQEATAAAAVDDEVRDGERRAAP
jgi:acyl carrier protein